MKVLIGCEYSGIVRDAFTEAGHTAFSCDIRETESPGPHYKGDVMKERSRFFTGIAEAMAEQWT